MPNIWLHTGPTGSAAKVYPDGAMKRIYALLFALMCALPLAAAAQQLLPAEGLQSLVAPVARYPDNAIAELAAAAADPLLIDYLPSPELRTFLLENPDWAMQFAYSYSLQQNDLWQALYALREGPPAGGMAYYPLVTAMTIIVRQPVIVRSFTHTHGQAVSRNGAPSAAAQMQAASSAAYLERARTANQPSPAARLQQGQPGLLPGFTPYRRIPEAQRRPIIQSH